ncbi:MAG TPA: hypothetical protein VKX17_17955 [Planctomycetota bacterium]|nr:hypothetical protein [Planctomycetota bacterium]
MRLSETAVRQVAYKLGHYVYVYVNPIDNSVFYIGKGKGSRALVHLDAGNKKVRRMIKAIRNLEKEPRIEILAKNLSSAKAAHKIEAAAIELFGIDKLGNLIRGHGSKGLRTPIEDVIASLVTEKARIIEPSILIRIRQFYVRGMTDVELYDATRRCWKIADWRREKIQLAFAVYEGIIREVYEITGWHQGGQTFCTHRDGRRADWTNRWEFVGVIARNRIRDRYLNRSVAHLFSTGARNSIQYVNFE